LTLRQDSIDHSAVHVGQPEVAACVAVGQSFVIEAEQVKHGGMEVVDRNGIFNGSETEIIRGSINGSTFDSAPGEPI